MIEKELSTLAVIDMDAGELFSGSPSGRTIKGFATPCGFTPHIDSDYLFHESIREVVVWLLTAPGERSDPLYIFGPTGSGKTSLVRQLAARLNYPVFDVTGHGRLEFPDLAGHLSLHNGSMEFQYGPLALAMRYGGIFLLNEMDLLDPATATGLNGVLDGGPLCIPENGGEIIHPHPMFRFVATANTNGASDDSGLYQGTLRQNIALMDRFWLCEVSYPAPATEETLLERVASGIPPDTRKAMVMFANEVRRLFVGESDTQKHGETIEVTFSTRTLIRWATLAIRFQPLARQGIQPIRYALDRALGYRASRETRAVLHELAQRMFPTAETTTNTP